jgi:hypothetical protein
MSRNDVSMRSARKALIHFELEIKDTYLRIQLKSSIFYPRFIEMSKDKTISAHFM